MKRLGLIVLFVLAGAVLAPAVFRSMIIIEWYNIVGAPIPDGYVLHATNDLSAPLTNWPVYTTFLEPLAGNSNALYFTSVITNRVTIPVTPGVMFYYLTASNFWGESNPSQIAWTPPTPQNPAKTTIR